MPKGVDTKNDPARRPEYPRPQEGGYGGKPPRKPPTKTGGSKPPEPEDPRKKGPDYDNKMRWENGYDKP